jgi:hypothetical protein
MKEKTILDTSDEAAQQVTITGWKGGGFFYGNDERSARYAGCTHRKCETCENITPKSRIYCETCQSKRDRERYEKLPLVEWDGETPLVIFRDDRYFFDADDFFDWCECEEIDPASVMLVLCEPEYLHQIDTDTWSDDLPEDGELPDDVAAAVDALNKVIAAAGPSCWREGKQRVTLQRH